MIEISVDDSYVEPNAFEFHSQEIPHPGGHRYRLSCTDEELVSVCRARFSLETLPLSLSKAAHLFNMVRMYVSLKTRRSEPSYWANTVDKLKIADAIIEIEGTCSVHVPTDS